MLFVQNFPDPKSQNFFSKIFPPKILMPFFHRQDIYNQTHYIMDIQQYIFNNTGVLLPISGGNGQSQGQAIVIGSEAKYRLIQVENEFISTMLDEGYWKKVEQSLIQSNDNKYDKISIHHFLDDGLVVERVFWFDVTKCFGI
jgi:hypothetical protein